MAVVADRCPGEDVFADWLDAKLDDASIKVLHAHLDVCAACRTLFAELSRLAGKAPSIDPEAETVGLEAKTIGPPAKLQTPARS